MVPNSRHLPHWENPNFVNPAILRFLADHPTPHSPPLPALQSPFLSSPACTLAELTVVALPCAWIYCVVGQHLLRKGPPAPKHPYREWLLLYGSPEFAEVTRWMRALVDKEAQRAGKAEQERMCDAFLTSSRYEWMFWDMAWREEQWPV